MFFNTSDYQYSSDFIEKIMKKWDLPAMKDRIISLAYTMISKSLYDKTEIQSHQKAGLMKEIEDLWFLESEQRKGLKQLSKDILENKDEPELKAVDLIDIAMQKNQADYKKNENKPYKDFYDTFVDIANITQKIFRGNL